MEKERPVAVTVIAILHFVLGGLGLLCQLCAGIGLGGILVMAAGSGNDPASFFMKEYINSLNRNAPGYLPISGGLACLGFVIAIVLIASGIGLLQMQKWARFASIGYAIVAILVGFVNLGYTIAVVNPAVTKAQEDAVRATAQKFGGKQGMPGASPNIGGQIGGTIGALIGSVISMIYPIAVLIVMFLPNVSQAFREGGVRRRRDEDYGDFDRERY